MISAFLPLAGSGTARAQRKGRTETRLAWCLLATVALLESALHLFRDAMLLAPVQGTHGFKQLSGYTMVALMVFTMGYGWLRRRPAFATKLRTLNDAHQFAGLLVLVLLGLHVGRAPSGFLLLMFHGLAVGLGAGALRAVLGTRLGRRAALLLLVMHIVMACLVCAGVLLHLYFVYAYTA